MQRRDFARALAGTALTAAIPQISRSQTKDVPFKLSIMLWTVYRDLPFEQRLEKVAEAGYRAVELVGEFEKWSDGDFRRINAKKKSLGITFERNRRPTGAGCFSRGTQHIRSHGTETGMSGDHRAFRKPGRKSS